MSILSEIIRIILRRPKSVEQILSTFSKTQRELENTIQKNTKKADKRRATALYLQAAAEKNMAEAKHADRVSQKILDLIT